jgi:uncharacterized membrane protein
VPLIGADQTFALGAAIMVLVAAALWAERTRLGQQLGGPLLLLGAAMLLANLGVIPHSAPLYGTVAGVLVPLAIPVLLLRADLRTMLGESGRLLGLFVLAAAATVAGALVGVAMIDLGPLEPQVAGTITASYIGGSLNFVATAEAVGIRDSSIYVAALSADAVGAVIFLLLLMSLPTLRFVRAAMPSRFPETGADTGSEATAPEVAPAAPFDLAGAAIGLAVSFVICAVSLWLARRFGAESYHVLLITALALLVANTAKPLVRRVSADFQIGTLLMYVFFACIGAGANLAEVLNAALPILLFILVMVAVHLVVVVTVGALLRLDLAEVLIASNACILGPATAAALAASRGWKALVAPGIVVGVFGYAIASFIGVAMTTALIAW